MGVDDSPSPPAPAARRGDAAPSRSRTGPEQPDRRAVVGELVGAITHDLRQPFTAVEMNISAALVFLRRPTPMVSAAADALDDALGQQRRIRGALHVLQYLATQRAPRHEPLDLSGVVREVAALASSEADSRGVPIQLDLADRPPAISGDLVLVRQALLHLVLDAVEATAQAGADRRPVRVAVRQAPPTDATTSAKDLEPAAVTEADGYTDVEVAYADTPDSAAHHAGDWGLALARTVALAHGASVSFRDEPDVGRTVLTRWPHRPAPHPARSSVADA